MASIENPDADPDLHDLNPRPDAASSENRSRPDPQLANQVIAMEPANPAPDAHADQSSRGHKGVLVDDRTQRATSKRVDGGAVNVNADSGFSDDGLDAAINITIPPSIAENGEASSVDIDEDVTDTRAHFKSAAEEARTPHPVQISQPTPFVPDAAAELAAQTTRVAEILSKLAQGLEDSKVVSKLASLTASETANEELDPPGEEMGPNAKIWDIYLDEAKHYDDAMLDGWNKGLDVLLVFAGLFSAILTTFLVQASTHLSPDPSIATNTPLNEIIVLLNSTSDRSSLVSLTTFTLSPTARWVNGLWFSSLALALSSALLSILAKQWLQAYRPMKCGDIPRENARRRQRLLRSFESWRVGAIIDTTPIILHISLLLFFAGLVVFVWTL